MIQSFTTAAASIFPSSSGSNQSVLRRNRRSFGKRVKSNISQHEDDDNDDNFDDIHNGNQILRSPPIPVVSNRIHLHSSDRKGSIGPFLSSCKFKMHSVKEPGSYISLGDDQETKDQIRPNRLSTELPQNIVVHEPSSLPPSTSGQSDQGTCHQQLHMLSPGVERRRSNSCSSVSTSASDDEDSFLPPQYYFHKVVRGNEKTSKCSGTLSPRLSAYVEDDGSATASSSGSEDADDVATVRSEITAATVQQSSLLIQKRRQLIHEEDKTSSAMISGLVEDQQKPIAASSWSSLGAVHCNPALDPTKQDNRDSSVDHRRSSSTVSLHQKKLMPPPSSSCAPPRSRRYRLLQQQGIGDECPFLFSTSNKLATLHLSSSRSFDTFETTDSDSFVSYFSSTRMEEDFYAPFSLFDDIDGIGSCASFDLPGLDVADNTTSCQTIAINNNSALRWSDECGMPLVTVQNIPTVPEETCRVIIVLMNAPLAPYEFLHCEFKTQSRLRVNDILKQLPGLRKQNDVEEMNQQELPVEITYSRLCALGKELINILAIQDYFGVGDSDYTLRDGIVFLAVRPGCDCKAAMVEGGNLLANQKLRREIRKARIAGRALRSLMSSDEWARFELLQKKAKIYRKGKKRRGTFVQMQPRDLFFNVACDEVSNIQKLLNAQEIVSIDGNATNDDISRCSDNVSAWIGLDQNQYMLHEQFVEDGVSYDIRSCRVGSIDGDGVRNLSNVGIALCTKSPSNNTETIDTSLSILDNDQKHLISGQSQLLSLEGSNEANLSNDVESVLSTVVDCTMIDLPSGGSIFVAEDDDDDDDVLIPTTIETLMTTKDGEKNIIQRVLTRSDSSDMIDLLHVVQNPDEEVLLGG